MTILTTAGLLTACSSGDEDSIPVEKPRRITVEVTQRPLVGDAQARDFDTRSDITTEVPDFSLYGGGITYTLSKATGKWVATPNYWPRGVADDASVPFYAYTTNSVNAFQYNNGDPYVSLTVDENAFSQHDLLVATNTVSFVSGGGKVPLTFDHACAAVAFNVYMTKALSDKLKENSKTTLTVTSIVLKNVKNKSKYYYNRDSNKWDTPVYKYTEPNKPCYTLTDSEITVGLADESKALPCGNLFMIPQTSTANGTEGTYLEVNYRIDSGAVKTANIAFDINWAAGTKYTIDIKLGTSTITL